MAYEYDLVVIGAGPAGYVGAIHAAQLGMKTALVEAKQIGGVCCNWGCIPSKAILHCAEIYELARAQGSRADCGIRADNLRYDYGVVVDKSRRAADRLSRSIEALLRKNNVDIIAARGRLLGPHTVQVRTCEPTERNIETRFVLLATGARPHLLPTINVEEERILTSREALALREVPKSVVIIGGGAIGLEFSSIWASYGSKVTVVEAEDQVPPYGDKEIARELQNVLTRRGVSFILGMKCREVNVQADGVRAIIHSDTSEQTVEADKALLAIGVVPNTEALGLETVGIETERRWVKVSRGYRTACDSVWAVGDLIGLPLLAHSGSAQAMAAVNSMAGRGDYDIRLETVPACLYTYPEMSNVGWSEKRAREERKNVGIAKSHFAANGKAIAMGLTDGFVKLIYDKDTREILGCHMLGHGVTELINQFAMAITARLTVEQVAHTIIAHPTLSEVIGQAALDALGQAVSA